ncbi:hypothetical protein NIES3974_41260 [Calothrix sp. NIES-3974]|nr:hypothetical protein NIES3974_41260 [Calothrix sp. NIES-3974]
MKKVEIEDSLRYLFYRSILIEYIVELKSISLYIYTYRFQLQIKFLFSFQLIA